MDLLDFGTIMVRNSGFQIFRGNSVLVHEIEVIHTASSLLHLNHLSLASYTRDIGKQCRQRSDAAECGI